LVSQVVAALSSLLGREVGAVFSHLALLALVFGSHFLFHVAPTFLERVLIFCHAGVLGDWGQQCDAMELAEVARAFRSSAKKCTAALVRGSARILNG
jgi:hypothetical protein